MPTPQRLVLPNTPLHITQRGVNRGATFLGDEDFAFYLLALDGASRAARCAVHAYALMTNHVHLLVTPADGAGPMRLMRALGARYVRYFNERYRRTGTLWEGRFRSTVILSDRYFFTCSRYIECNPQRAGITADVGSYAWSSFQRNAYGHADGIVTEHPLYTALGSDAAARCDAYRLLFAAELSSVSVAAVCTPSVVRRTLYRTRYQEAVAALSDAPIGMLARSPRVK